MDNNKLMSRRPFLITALALAALAIDCGPAESDAPDSLVQALTTHSVGPIGNSSGTMEGTGSDQLTPVTKIIAYASGAYVYGLQLWWGSISKMYGYENGLTGDELDFTGDLVKEIKYSVDEAGILRGIRLKTVSGTAFLIGSLSVGQTVAFSGANYRFTDLVTYKGTVNGVLTIWGATFHYTTP